MRYTGLPPGHHQFCMKDAEREYLDRLKRYGREEVTPEDCRTTLEKYGFVGLQERWDRYPEVTS